jgi:hypothetical protein
MVECGKSLLNINTAAPSLQMDYCVLSTRNICISLGPEVTVYSLIDVVLVGQAKSQQSNEGIGESYARL